MSPTAGVDHCPCRTLSPTELSSHFSLPLSMSSAMIDGAFGEGTLTWLSSWPLPVLQYSRPPSATGEQLARLCGNAPTSSIMSNVQRMSGSSLPVSFSSFVGPSFSLS